MIFGSLINVIVNPFPASALHQEEIDLLLSVANRFVERYPAVCRQELKGSFCLVGQKDGEYPEEILRFDFPGGAYASRTNTESATLVSASIENAIKENENTFYDYHEKHAADTLTLKTKYGRFIMGVYLSPRDLMRDILLHMACALKEIGYANPGDKTLMFSFEGIHIHKAERPELTRLESEIWGNAFSAPEMIAWKFWHNSHERVKGKFGLFFEKQPEGLLLEDPTDIKLKSPNTIKTIRPVLLRA